MRQDYRHVWSIDDYADAATCRHLLQEIEAYRHAHLVPEVRRPARERALRYFVIDGLQIAKAFPGLQDLYRRIKMIAEEKSGLALDFMANERVAININITPPGGEYRWHYDRNALTAILFLNSVAGGETEIYPGYRLKLRNKHSRTQKFLDSLLFQPWIRGLFGKMTSFPPCAGRLLLMRGDRCLHSVRAVQGIEDRINILFSYERPGESNPHGEGLDDYLYTQKDDPPADPNYLA